MDATLQPAVIEDARRRRQRRRRLTGLGIVAAACCVATGAYVLSGGGGGSTSRRAARSAPAATRVLFEYLTSTSTSPVQGHLRASMAVLRRSRSHADRLPLLTRSLIAHDESKPIFRESRRVATPEGPVFVVPTRAGCLLVLGNGGDECDPGLQGGIFLNVEGSGSRTRIYGIAADAVSRIVLVAPTAFAGKTRRVSLHDNVFSAVVPHKATTQLPDLGALFIYYRDGRKPEFARLG